MNEHPDPIEDLLRAAPTPRPPRNLADTLRAGIALAPGSAGIARPEASFWKRWWPVLFPGAATVALAAVVAVQQLELRDLRTASVTPVAEGAQAPSAAATGPVGTTAATPTAGVGGDEFAELERLRARVWELTAALEGGEALKAENARLEAAISAQKASQPPELQELAEARDRALRIHCVNNLKQLGLAVRLHATDHQDDFPSELAQLVPYLGNAFKVLVCPADESRPVAKDAESLTAANCSYEFLAPGPGKFETDPQRVMFRCPIHGNVGLCDGSVQMIDANQRDRLVQRDGKLYFVQPTQTPSTPTTPP
jgi:hypothetical protein